MAAQKGRLFLLGVWDGVSAYDNIIQARSTDMTINNETVDVSNKGTAGFRALLEGAGITSMSISLEGVYEDTAEEAVLAGHALANTHEQYQIISETGDTYTGTFALTSYGRSGVYNGEEVFSISLESAGTVTFTAA